MNELDFSGKQVLVVGGSSGIGFELARQFLEHDFDVVIAADDAAGLEQARQALANLRTVLAEAGATPADVVRLRTYVVNHSPDKLQPVTEEIMAFYDGAVPAANTWIGVQSLAMPEFLIEIEAIAAL